MLFDLARDAFATLLSPIARGSRWLYFFRIMINVFSFEPSLSGGSGVPETVLAGVAVAGGDTVDGVDAMASQLSSELMLQGYRTK